MFREPLFHGKEIYHSIVQRWEDLHFFTSKAATPCPMSPWKPGKASRFNCEKKPGSLGYIGKNLYFVLPFFFSFQRAILFPWQSWESLKRSSSRIYIYIHIFFGFPLWSIYPCEVAVCLDVKMPFDAWFPVFIGASLEKLEIVRGNFLFLGDTENSPRTSYSSYSLEKEKKTSPQKFLVFMIVPTSNPTKNAGNICIKREYRKMRSW